MARGKKTSEFSKIKVEIHKAKDKLRETERKLKAGKAKATSRKKVVKKLLSQLKSAYLKLGNIEPF